MSLNSDNEAKAAVNFIVEQIEKNVRSLLKTRKEAGKHSTQYPKTEIYSERGAVYIEFDDMLGQYPKLILARIGPELELRLFVGDFQKIQSLQLIHNFGEYSTAAVEKAIDMYFSHVCRIIEMS